MKKTALLALLALAACQPGGQQTATEENETKVFPETSSSEQTAEIQPDTLCFERHSGSRGQDVARLRVIVAGEGVQGQYENLPFEKDRSVGRVTGRRTNGVYTLSWAYRQEGVSQSRTLYFQEADGGLRRRPDSVSVQTGELVGNPGGAFTETYSRVKCW